uniref:pro-resilin-like isoform X1 n=1 Tax=Bombus vancouverensis nearcticus TaxID=2705178 RepID=UPI001439C91B|nr:pro-resilin-like isoform X1 [Bombus vancouverensis nearcticus]XP_033198272.1 pro-resilin-like isoform X1 [Bombus vancouverensis nearcticus]
MIQLVKKKKIAILCMAVVHVICDLPPGTRRNTYLPPEPTKGYTYDTPRIPFTKPTTPRPSFPTTTPYSSRPYSKPTPSKFPPSRTTPSEGYPPTGTRPTPEFPDYGTPTRPTGTTLPAGGHDHHHHEPGMPFDFNYAVKEDAFGNDYSHNAISDGDIVRGEYRVQLPDGRLQVVRYTADWKHGFSAQVSYDGNPRFDVPRPPGNFAGY